MKKAKIDIVGGDGDFFEQITSAVKGGKAIDQFVFNSRVASDIKNTFFNGSPEYFKENLSQMLGHFNLSTGEIKDLSVAAMIAQLMSNSSATDRMKNQLVQLLGTAGTLNLADQPIGKLLGESKPARKTPTKTGG